MKRIVVLFALWAVPANAQISCGIPPIPPVMCTTALPACVCTASGQCGWVYIGCN